MEKRTELILSTIIKEYIKSAVPVGSGVLVDKYNLGISSATVRNEMSLLEEKGYIVQPHTSAGRVPTETAYKFYFNSLKDKKLAESETKVLLETLGSKGEQDFKQTAKAMAQFSGQTIFWAFHKNNFYYTGVANLLSQPEFNQPELIYDISAIIDRMDEIIDQIFEEVEFEPQVFIGNDNPFSAICSTMITKYRTEEATGLFGLLGPMRMNYEKNLALVKFIKSKLQ